MGQPTFSTISERLNEDDSQKRVKFVDSCEGIERRGTARVGTERDGTRDFVNESQAKHAVLRAMIPRMTDGQ